MDKNQKEYNRLYRLKNKEKIAALNKLWYQQNKQRIAEVSAEKRRLTKEYKQTQGTWRKHTKPKTPRPPVKIFTNEEILELVNLYKKQPNKCWCPLTNKTYSTMAIVAGVMATKMEKSCLNQYMFLLQEPHYSIFSGDRLTEDDFSYSETYKGWTGFKKYTKEEREKKIWKHHRNTSTFNTKEYKNKASTLGKAFNKSEKGIQRRKEKSERMKAFYQTEEGKLHKQRSNKKASDTMRRKISEGEYTPNITNSWTHWNSYIELQDGSVRRFRSSLEACFFYSNQHMLYENIRIKTEDRVYVGDFFDENTNTLYEIKPRNRYNIEIDKMTNLQSFCVKHGYKFIWVNEHNLLDYVDTEKMMQDIKNKIQLEKAIKDPIMKGIYESKNIKN